MPPRAKVRSSPDEDERLRALIVKSVSFNRISTIFKRSVKGRDQSSQNLEGRVGRFAYLSDRHEMI